MVSSVSKITSFSLEGRIKTYFVIMLLGVMARTYITHSITIVWVFNLIGLLLVFLPYFRYINRTIIRLIIIYIIFGLVTVAINAKYLTGSLKSIGTNVNILVFPLMLIISVSSKTREELNEQALVNVFSTISLFGLISLMFAWIIDFSDIIRVINGTSVYWVEVGGFFYSKNIYGAFVSLTIAADYFLFAKKRNAKWIIIAGLKLLAVVVSFSRAALLQAGIMLFVFFWVKKLRTIKDHIILVAIICMVITAIVYIKSNANLYAFLYNSVFRVSSGDAGREFLRKQAISRVSDDFFGSVFGVGFAGIDALDIDVDNTYLYVWFSGGIIKIAFYFSALIASFIQIYRIKLIHGDLYRTCLAVGISYLFFAFFESVAVLELGLLNFLFTFFMFIVPFSQDNVLETE